MWINEDVDVLARHVAGIHHPLVKAIRWKNRRIDMKGAGRVERKTIGLEYTCTDGVDRYFLQFCPASDRWTLLSIDDGGIREPDDPPLPRVFPRPDWY